MRWTVIEQAVDCRTDEERDPSSKEYIPKSRYSAMNHYLSDHEFVQDSHNNGDKIRYSQEYLDDIKKGCPNISDRLAQHFAEIFTRDPIPAYEGEFLEEQINNNEMTGHFENL